MNSEKAKENYDQFINTLLKDLNLDKLPEEEKEEVVKRITSIAEHRILQTILLTAKEEDVKEVEKEIDDASDPEEVYLALADKIDGLDVKISNTLSELYINLKESLENN